MATSFYSDARHPQRRDVSVSCAMDGMRFVDSNGLMVAFWPYDGLSLIQDRSTKIPYKLCHSKISEASLMSEDLGLLDALLKIRPELDSAKIIGIWSRLRTPLLVAAGLISIYLFALSARFLASPLALLVPYKIEQRIGGQLTKRLSDEVGRCSYGPGLKALEHLVGRFTSAVSLPYPIKAQIVDSPEIDSVALPGGTILIYRGMLERFQSSDEVAGLLAHQIAHSVRRDTLANMISTLGIGFLASSLNESTSALLFTKEQLKASVLSLQHRPAQESDSDAAAHAMLQSSAIASSGVKNFFGRLRKSAPADGTNFISRHPQAGTSLDPVKLAPGSKGSGLAESEWKELKKICSEKIVIYPY